MQVTYFDGIHPLAQTAELHLNHGQLDLTVGNLKRQFRLTDLGICELAQTQQASLYFPDGSSVQVQLGPDPQSQALLQAIPALRPRWLSLIEKSRFVMLALVMLLLGLGYWYHDQGVNSITSFIVARLPESADSKLGEIALKHLYGKSILTESRRSDEFLAEVRKELQQFEFPIPLNQLDLRFANMADRTPNALALPNHTIIVTDGMLDKLPFHNELNREQRLIALAGIIAHEMGHVHYRHGTRGMVSVAVNSVLSSFFLGDVSEQLGLAAFALLQSGYSRELEQEADDYALQWLQQQGLSGAHSAVFLQDVIKYQEQKMGKPPRWLRWLSSHPEDHQRIANWQKLKGR